MDQTTPPAADQPTEQATATPAPAAETPTPDQQPTDLNRDRLSNVVAQLNADHPLTGSLADPDLPSDAPVAAAAGARCRKMIADLREIQGEAERTPNLGALVARLAGMLGDVMEEAASEFEQLAARG